MIRLLRAHGGTRSPETPCGYLGREDLAKMFEIVKYTHIFNEILTANIAYFHKVAL